jgi:hypothetical protein
MSRRARDCLGDGCGRCTVQEADRIVVQLAVLASLDWSGVPDRDVVAEVPAQAGEAGGGHLLPPFVADFLG